MASVTRWVDKESISLENTIDNIMTISERENDSEVTTRYCNWKSEKMFNEIEVTQFNNREIKYSYFSISFDSVRPGVEPVEDRTTHNKCFVIVYFNGSSVNYIIDRNSDAKTILRKLLNYSGKNEIMENNFKVDSDLFIWLISKVYHDENTIEINSQTDVKLVLKSIRGFKGDSQDYLTKVSASGESVMKIISTLSFILESRNINQIKINIDYGNNRGIIIELNINNSIRINTERYIGDYIMEVEEKKISQLYLLFYLEIFPNLIQSYQNEKDSELWNREKNIEFLKDVAKALTESIDIKLNTLISE
ncbi:hypothetical protein K8O96_12215 [Clostridium sporogenes]|uniref:Uncharacterized protein n=1 Tax=Clostridium botulinum TaxID=1491 RepID=A0A6M0SW05_CLOBO|nr:hypothetical protein [Clostridium sporogenes]NFA59444.1 hypothetical protein [Clostridium botulinum]NFI74628.1 hypothetical protein [Clostridium sporogenes]NFL71237.1 hypothetical protein [Clostridium sporogenes]NFM25400.1 hypothetical protein [Clostridium sporogenes]NFP62510.1 hypothetical protein [Clostridium sporogenes]